VQRSRSSGVFLEDIARRGLGRFSGLERDERLVALCHIGANVVPSGESCGSFAEATARGQARMIIGEERAVDELWAGVRRRMPEPRDDRRGQPVYVLEETPEPGETGLRAATLNDLELLVPACAAAHREEIGIDPLRRDPEGFRWRTRAQIEERRIVDLARGGRDRVQGGGVGVDAFGGAAPAGVG